MQTRIDQLENLVLDLMHQNSVPAPRPSQRDSRSPTQSQPAPHPHSENLARQHTLNPHPHRSSQKLKRPLRRLHLNMEASTFAVHDPSMSAVHIGLPSLVALPNYDPTFLRKKMRSIRPLTWLCHRQAFPGCNFSTVV
jgi:hypothetical protein